MTRAWGAKARGRRCHPGPIFFQAADGQGVFLRPDRSSGVFVSWECGKSSPQQTYPGEAALSPSRPPVSRPSVRQVYHMAHRHLVSHHLPRRGNPGPTSLHSVLPITFCRRGVQRHANLHHLPNLLPYKAVKHSFRVGIRFALTERRDRRHGRRDAGLRRPRIEQHRDAEGDQGMGIIRAWKGVDDRKSLSEAARASAPTQPDSS